MISGKTKADFRARRMMLGLTQADVAEDLGVTVLSVKRWEREGFNDPPDEAWNLIAYHEEMQARTVAEIVECFPDGADATITIYRSQEEYEAVKALHGGEGVETFGVANATAMEAARTLDALGVEVVFRYPCVE